jgi:alpha-mannosidase
MREWESSQMGEYGWPKYAEYRHALMPHGGTLTNAGRLRMASAFSRPLLARVGPCHRGELPAARGFVTVMPDAAHLSALRKKADGGLEIRVVEVEGRKSAASVELGFPVTGACETNLLGAKVADVERKNHQLRFDIQPWKIRTFEITP